MPLVSARFAGRPHRFAVDALLGDGRTVQAHLADPGRLRDLLLPGAELRLRPVPPHVERKTRYTAVLVRAAGSRVWVSLEAARANTLAERALGDGTVTGFDGATLRPEVRHGDSRFDFLAQRRKRRCWIEVKSVTWASDGEGRFPDAPTRRGRRHVDELAALAGGADDALLLFVVQRGDAVAVRPAGEIDPEFAAALERARGAGVRIEALVFELDAGGEARFVRRAAVTAAANAVP